MTTLRIRSLGRVGVTWTVLTVASLAVVVGAVLTSASPVLASATIIACAVALTAWLAVTRFELFTLVMIAARTAVDIAHTGADAGPLRLSAIVTGVYTVAAVGWLVRRRIRGRLRVSAVSVWVAVFALIALISAGFSAEPAVALDGASKWIFLAAFVLVLDNLIVDGRSVQKVLIAVVASTLVPLTMGMWQFFFGAVESDGLPRIEGSFSHPNTFGFYLVVIVLVLVAVMPEIKRSWRVPAGLILLASIVSLMATYSRTSYASLLIGLGVLIVLGRRWALLAICAIALAASLMFPGVQERVSDIGTATTVRGTSGDTLSWRLGYWQVVMEAGEDQRITGLGLGVASQVTDQGREPHNDYLRALVEVGILGLLAYIGLMAAIGRSIFRALRVTNSNSRHGPLSRALAEGFAAVFAAYLVGSLTGNLMTQLVLLWYVLAVGVVATVPFEPGRRIASSQAPSSHTA